MNDQDCPATYVLRLLENHLIKNCPSAETYLLRLMENPFEILPPRVASTISPESAASLAFIRKILYKIQPNQYHIILLYEGGTGVAGTSDHTILQSRRGTCASGASYDCKEYW